MDDYTVRELLATVNCAACGRRYGVQDINILYHQRELWFVSVFCQGCQTKGLVAALIKWGEAPLITDLTEEEAVRFRESPAIGADDVLDLHNFLEGFDGDFGSLFGEKDRQV